MRSLKLRSDLRINFNSLSFFKSVTQSVWVNLGYTAHCPEAFQAQMEIAISFIQWLCVSSRGRAQREG